MHHDQYLDNNHYTFIDHGGGSHLPLLLACVAATTGPVLEIGVGHGSTPCLHSVCCPNRKLVSLEEDAKWLETFKAGECDGHTVELDSPAHLAELATQRWGVVFIDDSPGPPRADHVRMFPVADYVVVHDAEGEDIMVPTRPVIAGVPHQFIYKTFFPWTLAVSLTHPIPRVP